MDIKGRIIKLGAVTTGTSTRTGNTWAKQEVVVEYFENESSRFVDRAVVTIYGEDRIREADLREGDEVRMGFGHSAREYNGRYFNELRAYRVEKVARLQAVGDTTPQTALNEPTATPTATEQAPLPPTTEKPDDLPF